MEESRLPQLLALWMAVILLVAAVRWRRKHGGVGLTVAYLLNLWLIHWLAVSLYLIPGFQNNDARIVELGFEQSTYAVLAFAFGAVALMPLLRNLRTATAAVTHVPDPNLPRAYIALGVVAFLLLSSVGSLPSVTSIVSTGQELVIVGLGLCCWQAWRQKNFSTFAFWIGATMLLPFITIVTRGFIGYGAVASLTILIFVASFIRSRFAITAIAIVVGYVGLSFYVTYMRDRGEIREVVWGGQSFADRIARISTTIETFEWFDPSNNDHLDRIDDRLNQNVLVGSAVSRLTDLGGFARGSTLWDALLALIPRALWPDKPITAGSGHLVTDYTGIQYAVGTSVGIGQVMEFYVNFGTLGVIIGFVVMGVLVTLLDQFAADRLALGDLHGFVLFFLPGIALLQVGGQLVEVTTSAAASVLVAIVVNKYLARLQQKQAPQGGTVLSAPLTAGQP